MKRCPECRRDYFDDSLFYCLDDGATLLEGPGNLEPVTAILVDAGRLASSDPGEAATRIQENPIDKQSRPDNDKRKSLRLGNKPWVIGSAVVLAVLCIAGYRYLVNSGQDQIDSIAVLPFVNESANADVDYLSDGMTEALINTLAQLPNLSVKPRSTVFRYKGRESEVKTIGRELEVRAVLNGRFVQRGDDIALFLSLIDTGTGNQIWGKQYNRKLTGLVSLQSEVARDVSESLVPKLSEADEQKLAKSYTENSEAYQLYLRGRYHWNKFTVEERQKALQSFEQAIAVDPNYALAYTGLADTYTVMSFSSNEMIVKAKDAALKAVSLDDSLAEAHSALGFVLYARQFDFSGAEREYKRAIELNPKYFLARYLYAFFLIQNGRTEEAFAEQQIAMRTEPFSILVNRQYASFLLIANQPDKSIDQNRKMLDFDSDSAIHANLAYAFWQKGDYAACVEEFAKGQEEDGNKDLASLIRNEFTRAGWLGFLRLMTSPEHRSELTNLDLVRFYVALGENELAIDELQMAYDQRNALLLTVKVDPFLKPLDSDGRFQALLKKIGFPE